jgi:hypothetical protein
MATYHLSHGAANIVLKWLLDKRNPEAQFDVATGRFRLFYSRPFRLIIATFAVLSNIMLAFGIFVFRDELRSLIMSSLIFGLFWLGMLYAVYDTFLVRLSFTTEAIFRQGRLGEAVVVPWSLITEASYSSLCNWFTFRAESLPTIRISIYRDGLETFAQYASRGLEGSPAGTTPSLFDKL